MGQRRCRFPRTGAALVALALAVSPAVGWVATLNGRSGSAVVGSFDRAQDVAFDATGNVIAVGDVDAPFSGSSVDSVLVTKRDVATGEELWRQSLDDLFPLYRDLVSGRVAVDGAGDVIVSAGVEAAGAVAVVVKLSGATGQRLWVATGHGGGGLALFPDGDVAVIVPHATSSQVYNGVPYIPADCVARLAGSDGTERWRSPPTGFVGLDYFRIDPAGDVIAGGYSNGMLAIKLSGASGTFVWSKVLTGPAGYPGDIATGLAVDASGNVVLAGRLAVVFTQSDFAAELTIVKLAASTGTELWRFAESGHFPAGVVIGPSGDVFTAGSLSANGPEALRLDGDDGTEVWRAPAGGIDLTADVFSDGVDRLVVVGQVFEAAATRIALAAAELDPADGTRRQLLTVDEVGVYDPVLTGALGPDGRIALGGHLKHPDGLSDEDFAVVQFSHRLGGKKLVMRDLPGLQTLSLSSKDRSVLAGVPGGAADPTIQGATLTLDNPASGEQVAIALPTTMWTARQGKRPGAVRYIYKDPTHLAGPCKKVVIKGGGGIAVACNAGLGGFTLDEATQGALAVELRITDAARYCFGFVPTKDEPGLFVAPEAGVPADCPD